MCLCVLSIFVRAFYLLVLSQSPLFALQQKKTKAQKLVHLEKNIKLKTYNNRSNIKHFHFSHTNAPWAAATASIASNRLQNVSIFALFCVVLLNTVCQLRRWHAPFFQIGQSTCPLPHRLLYEYCVLALLAANCWAWCQGRICYTVPGGERWRSGQGFKPRSFFW